MELNGYSSENYIYLKVMKTIYDHDNCPIFKQGQILRFLRYDLENNLYSRFFNQSISNCINRERKDDLPDDAILPNSIYGDITFKEDCSAKLCLWPNETYCLSKYIMDHLGSHELEYPLFERAYYVDERNAEELKKYSEQIGETDDGYPVIKVVDGNLHLELKFKKGEKLDFTDPGVMSFFIEYLYANLIQNSHVIKGNLKEKLFERDFKNMFRAADDIFFSDFADEDSSFIYFKLNDDAKYKDLWKLPADNAHIYTKREDGCADIVYLQYSSYEVPERYEVCNLRKIGTEIPKEEAIKIHKEKLIQDKNYREKQQKKFMEEQMKKEEELDELFQEHANDEVMFPGINGNFKSTSTYDNDSTYTLDVIKKFYQSLSTLDQEVLSSMYFYGGTLPYVLTDASESREFGDIDIFVPIEKMQLVREALDKAGLIRSYDSIELTQEHEFTSKIKLSETEELNNSLNLMTSLLANDEKEIKNVFDRGRVYQDFGLKGNLFGVNISIFPVYQFQNDLLSKSFKISDAIDYLLVCNILHDSSIQDIAKNVTVYGNNINILPMEYTIVSKESAIENGYIKRTDKDYIDLEYIKNNKEKLGISDEVIEKLREKYPDFSIALAYFVYQNGIEKVSGERYKELVLMHGGEYVS